MKIFGSRKKDKPRQEHSTLQIRQQSYHYSSKRSNVDRLNQRRMSEDDHNNEASYKRWPNFLAVTLVIIGVLYMLHLSPNARITSLESSGQFIGDKNAVLATANEHLKSSFLNRFKLTFDSNKLEEELRAKYPEFTSIDVKTNLLWQRPLIEINFAKPTLLMDSDGRIFTVSEIGRAIAEYSESNNVDYDTSKLPLLQDLSGVDLKLGQQALTSEQVGYIKEMLYQTSTKGLTVSKMELMPGGGELRVYYSGLDYFVKYNFYEDPRQSSGAFIATKENLEKRAKTPQKYIDVRVAERAYIK